MKQTYGLAALAAGIVVVGFGVALAQGPGEGDRPPSKDREAGSGPREGGQGEREGGAGGREGGRPPGGREGGQGGGRQSGQGGAGRGGPPGGLMKFMPVLVALDADKNGEISADEIANAATALKTLDKNGDGKLTEEELRPSGPPPGGREGGPPPGGREGGAGGREGGPPPGGREREEGGERPKRPE